MANLLSSIRDVVIHDLHVMIDDVTKKVVSGQPSSFEEYKKQIGRIAGYHEAIEAIRKAFNKAGEEDDE